MGLADFQAYMIERLRSLDEATDLTPGSPADVQVIQPLLRRLGADPFTVDMGTFLSQRLVQEFPELATKEGDAITDLLIKTAMVLFDPLVRETERIRQNLSFRDPTLLTTEEAEALGANLFATRNTGDFARGTARLYFAQAQNLKVSPSNYVTSKSGLFYYPTEVQGIRVEEMLFNKEADLYYFDISLIAVKAGNEYNIGPDELVTIANLTSAVRITNKLRFRYGEPEESAVEFIDRIEQELSERSLVTLRGIVAKLTKGFPELSRLGVVGAGDREMRRDVITGGGLGPLLASGFSASALPDGENKVLTRRFQIDPMEADFTSLIGPVGTAASGYTVTLYDAFSLGSLPRVRDLVVEAVVDAQTLDLVDEVLVYTASARPWSLRRQELTLSNIPGGILFPSNADGSVSVPNGEVHVGGATDVLVRGSSFDSASLILSAVVDDSPVLEGKNLFTPGTTSNEVTLQDLVLGVSYAVGDATHQALDQAAVKGYALQILDSPNAGTYRVLAPAVQAVSLSPVLTVYPDVVVSENTPFRWRLLDVLDIDLLEPKETRVSGTDLFSVQGTDTLDTTSGIDFSSYGVGSGDVLRIHLGPLAGDYVIKEVGGPALDRGVRVDRAITRSVGGLKFSVFRMNPEGGLKLPLVRIDSIDLLDTSAEPVGSKIPYAKPVDIQTRAFANIAHGVKADFTDGLLGLVTLDLTNPTSRNLVGKDLSFECIGPSSPWFSLAFSGADPLFISDIADQLNQAYLAATGLPRFAVVLGQRIGILPVGLGLKVIGGSAREALFGAAITYAASDVRSDQGLPSLSPALDRIFDVVQVLDGHQIGAYGDLQVEGVRLQTGHDFFPEAGRHIQVGSRSIGSARTYFLEPTTIEFGKDAVFTLTDPDGSTLRYFPDPTVNYQRIPALPSGAKPKDGVVEDSATFTSSSVDFLAKGIQPDDLLIVDYQPITGDHLLDLVTSQPLDPIPNLTNKTLVLSIHGSSDRVVRFVNDDLTIAPTDVTLQGAADQINRTIGMVISRIVVDQLEFEADTSIIVRASGSANALLGLPTVDVKNDSPLKGGGFYPIRTVSVGSLTVDPILTYPLSRQQFKVYRAGVQRIGSTDMSKNVGTAGLYYFDVELVSEGTGDKYNIDASLAMTASGYASDGYYLTTDDPNLSFSELERPRLHISRSILEVGVADDPDNATLLSGQNLQVNYDRSSLVANVQSFVSADTERVVNESILCRHLIPYFVRFDLSYVGGAKENEITPEIESLITGLDPDSTLEVGAIEKLLSNRGAVSITNPVDLIAVIHNADRTLSVERSQDRLGTGRLAAFIPDVLNVTRKLG